MTALHEVLVGTQKTEVVLPVAICEYTLQIERLAWIQRRPFSYLLFQSTVPASAMKRAANAGRSDSTLCIRLFHWHPPVASVIPTRIGLSRPPGCQPGGVTVLLRWHVRLEGRQQR